MALIACGHMAQFVAAAHGDAGVVVARGDAPGGGLDPFATAGPRSRWCARPAAPDRSTRRRPARPATIRSAGCAAAVSRCRSCIADLLRAISVSAASVSAVSAVDPIVEHRPRIFCIAGFERLTDLGKNVSISQAAIGNGLQMQARFRVAQPRFQIIQQSFDGFVFGVDRRIDRLALAARAVSRLAIALPWLCAC